MKENRVLTGEVVTEKGKEIPTDTVDGIIGNTVNGLTALLTVDVENKRKLKNTVNAGIFRFLEKNGPSTLKEIENGLVKSRDKAFNSTVERALKLAEARGNPKTRRAFIAARVRKTINTYYLSPKTIEEIGRVLVKAVVDGKEKIFLTYRLVKTA